jgi:hypothetical protein
VANRTVVVAVSYLFDAACIGGIPGLLVAPNTFAQHLRYTPPKPMRSKIRGRVQMACSTASEHRRSPTARTGTGFLDDGLIQIAVGPVRLTVGAIRVFRIPPDGLTIELFL